jgi:formylglycine-generating enzyme required for sulfatase activity
MKQIGAAVAAVFGVVGLLAGSVQAQQCCTGNVSTYCTAGTSVQGCVPSISGVGVPDIAKATGFDILISQVPAQKMGLVFYGMSAIQQPQPWALGSTSYLCVYYPVARTGARFSGGSAGTCNGELRVDFNTFMTANPSALGAPFPAGQQFVAQGWYRDPGAAKGTNLSDALRFSLCTNAGDTTPPSITTCAANQTVGAASGCLGVVPNFTSGVVASDNCTIPAITQSPAVGAVVALGTHAVTLTATDAAGNTAQCVATLTVTDTLAPVFNPCAPNQTVSANSSCQAIVPDFTASAVAVDACGGSVALSQSPVAGSLTSARATSVPVTLTATDSAGNTSSCVATLSVTQTGACQLPSGFVAIQPGTFQMGEVGVASPVHAVTISYPFWMGAKEVTQAEYAALMGTNPSYFQGNASRPVEQVTWFNARSYCATLTAQQAALGAVPSGYEYRLPTEAEWEYACRAGTTTSWNVGNSLSCSQANHYSNGYCVGQTSVVGSYAPNAWGLYDMHGNVLEWCLDSYAGYSSSAVTDPFVTGGPNRVIRGGAWGSNSNNCRSALRWNGGPGDADGHTGIRVVLAPVLVP